MKRQTRLNLLRLVRVICIIADILYTLASFGFVIFSKQEVAKVGYVKPNISLNFLLAYTIWIIATIFCQWQIDKLNKEERK